MTVIWTRPARLDRIGIIRYIAKDNPDAAAWLNTRLSEAIKMLVRFPQSGRPGRVPGTRELVIHANYIVIYKLVGDTIAIVNVLHAAQQYP